MRPRDFDRVTSAPCDMLIIGGTYQGLAIAREAARRGLRPTLVEPFDFGADAVSHHAQIVPGGLHLLRRGRIGRARRALRTRRRLARVAPWLIRPLPFLEATRGTFPVSRVRWRAIFRIDNWIGRHRNDAVEPELHLPSARLVSKAATLRLFPGVRSDGLTGGIQWYDYQIVEPDRLAVALAAAAEAAGAELLNHVDVLDVVREGDRISGLRVRDAITRAEATLRAGLVVYVADAGGGSMAQALGVPRSATVREVSLVTSRPASDMALIATIGRGARLMLVPSRGRALIGVRTPSAPDAGNLDAPDTDVATLVTHANEAFPALRLTPDDITSVHAGVMAASIDGDAAEIAHHHQSGAITVAGTNVAAALDAASKVVRLASKRLGKPLRTPPVETSLPGAGIADHEALLIETARSLGLALAQPLMRHLIARYAEQAASIARLMASEPRLARPLSDREPHVAAEIVHAIRHEKACRLSDIVLRRLGVDISSQPNLEMLRGAAGVAAQELGWDSARIAAEVDAIGQATRPSTAG